MLETCIFRIQFPYSQPCRRDGFLLSTGRPPILAFGTMQSNPLEQRPGCAVEEDRDLDAVVQLRARLNLELAQLVLEVRDVSLEVSWLNFMVIAFASRPVAITFER